MQRGSQIGLGEPQFRLGQLEISLERYQERQGGPGIRASHEAEKITRDERQTHTHAKKRNKKNERKKENVSLIQWTG